MHGIISLFNHPIYISCYLPSVPDVHIMVRFTWIVTPHIVKPHKFDSTAV